MPPELTRMGLRVLGGWDLGVCVSLFLQGVLCAQFAHYTCLNKRKLGVDKALCGGPHDDAEELAIAVRHRALIWIQNVANVRESGGGIQLIAHTLAFADHPDTRSRHPRSPSDVFLPSSLGEGSRSTVISAQLIYWQAISRNAYLVTLYCIGATKSRNNRPSTYSLLRWTRRLDGTRVNVSYPTAPPLLSSTFYVGSHCRQTEVKFWGNCDLDYQTPVRSASRTLGVDNFYLRHVNNHDKLGTRPGRLYYEHGTPLFVRMVLRCGLSTRAKTCLTAANCPYTFNLGLSVGSSNSETTQYQHQGNLEPLAKVEKAQPDGPPESTA
ncbi:hypothetical protein B0H14DRAFT_2567144 [Mycena olivaceomarginata]|nr:hypothetical protein B0H14DRAFT_2567144 [Mycena olivaceomarginata]